MSPFKRLLFALLVFALSAFVLNAQPPKTVVTPVAAMVESSLETASGQIRQFAFDGDPETFFLSKGNAGAADHFTLVFDKPVAVKSIVVATGRPKGGDTLEDGILEVSADGKTFK